MDWNTYIPYALMGFVGFCGAITRAIKSGLSLRNGTKMVGEFATVVLIVSIVNFFGSLWLVSVEGKVAAAGICCWLGPEFVVNKVVDMFFKWRGIPNDKPV